MIFSLLIELVFTRQRLLRFFRRAAWSRGLLLAPSLLF
jgi:hypothetical protein